LALANPGVKPYVEQMDIPPPNPDRFSRNPSKQLTGNKVAPEKRAKVVEMIEAGESMKQIVREVGVAKDTAIAIRRAEEDKRGGLDLNTWKKNTAATLSEVVSKGANRLLSEVDNIPAGQLPLALAILTDKVMALQDAPAVVVEHRLRVSHEDINRMLKGEAEVIDITPVDKPPQIGA
jgi:hypothetical protein